MNRIIVVIALCCVASAVCEANIDKIFEFKKQNKACQDKTNISNEDIDSLASGTFPEGKPDLKCYIKCIMEQAKTMKDGKFDKDTALEMINTKLPEQFREDAKKVLNACSGKFDSITDPCELAWEMAKCWKNEIAKFKKAN